MGGKRFSGWHWGALLMVMLVSVSHRVMAATRSVVVLGTGSYSGLAQLQAELSALEIRAILIDAPPTGPAPERLAQFARDWGTTVAIEFVSEPDVLHVWLYDARTGGLPFKQSFPRDRGGDESARVEALRVAEYLRATLVKTTVRSGSDRPPLKSAKTRRSRAPRRTYWSTPLQDDASSEFESSELENGSDSDPGEGESSLWLNYSNGLLFNSGSSLASESTIGFMWQANPKFGLELRAMVPMSSARLSDAVGVAEFRTWGIGASARYSFTSPASRWRHLVAAGVSFLELPLKGTLAASGYGTTPPEALQVIAPHLELGLLWTVRKWFSVCPSLWAAYALPEPIVRFGGRDMARLGRPFLFFSIRVEWRAIDWGRTD